MTTTEVTKNRQNIDKWFGNRFLQERKLQEYQGVIQGSWVKVDFSNMRTRKYKEVDELLVIAILPSNNTFIGMTGSMNLIQTSIEIIKL